MRSTIFAAGLLQGICLVALPAASTIITSPHDFAFSSTAYGSLFIPQTLIAIFSSALNPKISRKLGSKWVFYTGIVANLLSMLLLALSSLFMHNFAAAFSMLLFAAGSLGLGFGFVVPTLNEQLALLYPSKVNSMLLILNALLGVGTTLAPVLIMVFIGLGFWWGLPAFLVVLLSLLFFYPFTESKEKVDKLISEKTPPRFWIFAAFALLYGIVETLNGNWVQIYMSRHLLADIRAGSLALTAFWGMVTCGRIFFTLIDRVFKEENAFKLAPFIACAAFFTISALRAGAVTSAVMAFGLMGLGCSVLLPLIISFGSKELKPIASAVPGRLISCYLLGYGIAAFGVGPLIEKTGATLQEIYMMGGIIALFLGLMSFAVVKNQP